MIKPDAVRMKMVGSILAFVEKAVTIKLVEMRMIRLTEPQVRQFYAEHDGKPFFWPLVDFTLSGPVVCMVLEGDDVVQWWRRAIGNTNPQKAEPGTVRHMCGMGQPNNAVHGSDSPESAAREIAMFRSWVAERKEQ
jgi:nucleoside-diphosphate kinase